MRGGGVQEYDIEDAYIQKKGTDMTTVCARRWSLYIVLYTKIIRKNKHNVDGRVMT